MLAVTATKGACVPGSANNSLQGAARARARACLIDVLPIDMPARDLFGAYVEAAVTADARGCHDVYMSSMNRLVHALSTEHGTELIQTYPCSVLARLKPVALHTRRPLEQLAQSLLLRMETINQDVSTEAAAIATAHRDRKHSKNPGAAAARRRRHDHAVHVRHVRRNLAREMMLFLSLWRWSTFVVRGLLFCFAFFTCGFG